MKTLIICALILAISYIGVSSYSEVNNTQEKNYNPRDTFNTAFTEIGNYFEYLFIEQIIQYRTYRLIIGDTLINNINYTVTKHYDPHYGTFYEHSYFDSDLRWLGRAPTCAMADSNGNIILIGFNFPVGYTWKRCFNNQSYTKVIEKEYTNILGDTTNLRYVATKDTFEFVPDERIYVEKFGLYEIYNFSGPIQELLVGAVIDSVVYGSVILNVQNQNNQIPSTFVLHQNFPNPFNSTTVIKFSTPTNQQLNFVIYDNLGREVQRLDGLFYYAGNHEISITGDNLTSGVYFYRVEAGDFIETKKMILIK